MSPIHTISQDENLCVRVSLSIQREVRYRLLQRFVGRVDDTWAWCDMNEGHDSSTIFPWEDGRTPKQRRYDNNIVVK